MAQPNPNSSPEGSERSGAHWPNPANEAAAAQPGQQPASNPAVIEHLDPKEVRSAAPAEGTGVTGTVPPA